MEKRIDLTQTVYQLTEAYPELIDIMASLGFTEIKKKAIRLSAGKLITIPKGAAMRGISMDLVVKALQDGGFTVVGDAPASVDNSIHSHLTGPSDEATRKIKLLLKRLNDGEPMESVRADFVRDFKDVPATNIMKAEQELIAEGQSAKEVKKLCDVHSALFHNKREDNLHHGMHHDQERMMMGQAAESKDKAASLRAIDGHPLQTFYRENDAIVKALDEVENAMRKDGDVAALLSQVRGLAIHYAKKGDLIYPLLNTKYGIYGPSQVMWTIDDEIRAEISSLLKPAASHDAQWLKRTEALVGRAREMTFKENRILFPVCVANFTDDDWRQIYVDSKAYAICLGVESPAWQDGEALLAKEKKENCQKATNVTDELRINMPGGSLTVSQLTALLDTLPMEVTFVDADNINRYFNQPFSAKSFKRPLAALGREVFSCHPPKIEPMVRAIINELREGKRDCVPVWLEKDGRTMLVNYHAVRDTDGNYVGTMETVQNMEEARKHFAK